MTDTPPAGRDGAGLRVDGLSVFYRTARGPVAAVRDMSFDIAPGETFGIVGESGCGKTTLSRALCGHLPGAAHLTTGRIHLAGIDILNLAPAALRRWRATELAVVHQEAGGALDPTMRIGAQVAEVLRLKGHRRADVRAETLRLLNRVRLPDPAALARRYPHQLSGGQQQRVIIAAALAARPRLLILDEPTTGLDATVEREILDLISTLRGELSAAVLLISHDLELVGGLCDRVGVLYAGRLVEQGPAGTVLARPRHPYTAALLGSVPRLGTTRQTRRLAAIPGRPPVPGGDTAGCGFAPRCGFADDLCTSNLPTLDQAPTVGQAVADHAVRCHHAARLHDRLRGDPSSSCGDDVPAVGVPDEGVPPVGVADEGVPPVGVPDEGVPLLEVRGLTRRYGRSTVVDNVDLRIERREVLGLVGESGSGKTTLARSIAGLSPRGSGAIRLAGEPLAPQVGRRGAARQRIQMIFQNPEATLNPRHTVRTVLTRALRSLRGSLSPQQLGARANLDDHLLDSRSDRLSGGQQQRVAIARAFAGDPDLVICDEPVSALDVSVQAGVLELLAEQQRGTGTSYLFISHDLAVVGYLADRIAVMYAGQLVEQGPAHSVLFGPHHPYTASLVAASLARLTPTQPSSPDSVATTLDSATGLPDSATGLPDSATAPTDGAAAVPGRDIAGPDRIARAAGRAAGADRVIAGPGRAVAVPDTAVTTGDRAAPVAGRAAGAGAAGRSGRSPIDLIGCRFAHRCPYRIDGICDTRQPPERRPGDGHTVRCHLDPASLPRTTSPLLQIQSPAPDPAK